MRDRHLALDKLTLVYHHVMEAYRGHKGKDPYSNNLDTVGHRVVFFTLQLCRKAPQYPLETKMSDF
jgi:hypothetical protein